MVQTSCPQYDSSAKEPPFCYYYWQKVCYLSFATAVHFLSKSSLSMRNTFSHGVPVGNSGLIHQESHRELRDCLL